MESKSKRKIYFLLIFCVQISFCSTKPLIELARTTKASSMDILLPESESNLDYPSDSYYYDNYDFNEDENEILKLNNSKQTVESSNSNLEFILEQTTKTTTKTPKTTVSYVFNLINFERTNNVHLNSTRIDSPSELTVVQELNQKKQQLENKYSSRYVLILILSLLSVVAVFLAIILVLFVIKNKRANKNSNGNTIDKQKTTFSTNPHYTSVNQIE